MTIEEIQSKIEDLQSLKYYETEAFAKFDGDAYIITKELNQNDIKITQLRKFFAAVKEIELYVKNKKQWNDEVNIKFYLLMPKLAYAKGRKVISDKFFDLMKVIMDKVGSGEEEDTYEDFIKFIQLLEAIVAFYKFNNPNAK